jgi:hypothetical protein
MTPSNLRGFACAGDVRLDESGRLAAADCSELPQQFPRSELDGRSAVLVRDASPNPTPTHAAEEERPMSGDVIYERVRMEAKRANPAMTEAQAISAFLDTERGRQLWRDYDRRPGARPDTGTLTRATEAFNAPGRHDQHAEHRFHTDPSGSVADVIEVTIRQEAQRVRRADETIEQATVRLMSENHGWFDAYEWARQFDVQHGR